MILKEIIDNETFDEPLTLEEVKKRIDSPDSDLDSEVEGLITAARIKLEKRYNISIPKRSRSYYFTEYEKELRIPGVNESYVLKVVDWEGEETTLTLGDEYSLFGNTIRFVSGGFNLIVTCDSGYDTIPKDIEKALISQIKYMFDGDWTGEKISPEVEAIMRPYDDLALV